MDNAFAGLPAMLRLTLQAGDVERHQFIIVCLVVLALVCVLIAGTRWV